MKDERKQNKTLNSPGLVADNRVVKMKVKII